MMFGPGEVILQTPVRACKLPSDIAIAFSLGSDRVRCCRPCSPFCSWSLSTTGSRVDTWMS